MKTVFIVNEADNFHSLNSFRLVGVATTKNKAIKLIKQALKEANHTEEMKAETLKQLQEINQTQQNFFDWEYNINEVEINTLT